MRVQIARLGLCLSVAFLFLCGMAAGEECIIGTPAIEGRNLLVGFGPNWGGAITNITPKGICTNLVNNGTPDPGRSVQVAFRRSEPPGSCWVCDAGCNREWNPTQGGSPCNGHVSGYLNLDVLPGVVHTKSQIYNFDDDDGRSQVYVDQWTQIPKDNAIQVNYAVKSLEPASFTDCQELPVAYLNPILNSAHRYTGASPWTAAPAETVSVPLEAPEGSGPPAPFSNTTEPWIAWIAADGRGLGLYIPTGEVHTTWQFHRVYPSGTTNTHVLQSWGCFTMNYGDQVNLRTHLIYGTLDQIRSTVYEYEGHAWFSDIPTGHAFYSWINKLFRNDITAGCALNPPRYCQSTAIPREQMAVFLLRAKHGSSYTPSACTAAPFTDVQASSPFCRWIKAAKEQGIMLGGPGEGCSAGTSYFCPGAAVTRAHMAAFLLRAKEGGTYLPAACEATPMFTDVPGSHPYCRWVEEIARREITAGCGGGYYCPDASNTRGQMAVFVSKNWGLK